MKERFEALYKELGTLLNLAPVEDDCTEEESIMYSYISSLMDAMFNVGYGH